MMLSHLIENKIDLSVKTTKENETRILNALEDYFIDISAEDEEAAFNIIPEEARDIGMFVTVSPAGTKYEHYFYGLDRTLFYIKLTCGYEPIWNVRLIVDKPVD